MAVSNFYPGLATETEQDKVKLQASDLRAGNYVHKWHYEAQDWGKPEEVNAAYIHWMDQGTAMCKGVEFTAEILSKCKFEPCGIKELNEFWFIRVENSSGYLQVERQAEFHYICERLELNNCKYLNQLQNLYHSLTGQELEIDL